MFESVDAESVKRRLRFDYVRVKNEPSLRALDGIASVMLHLHKPHITINDVLQEACDSIQKNFRLKWVMIGIKGKQDGLYRYTVMTGMRPDVWERQRKRVYREEDFEPSAEDYTFGEISNLTRVYLQEDNPLNTEDEKSLVHRPVLLETSRMTSKETLEADFINTLIYGPGRHLLGWIEYTGTVANEFPDSTVFRQIEAYASALGGVIAVYNRT
jgi:hypothetical protein